MRVKNVILCLLLFACNFLLQAQQFVFKNYSVQDGLPQSQVYALIQDSKGYLWTGTRGGGISKFNGRKFTNYTNKEGLCNNYILCIKEDLAHNLWIGTNDGYSFYNGSKFTNFLQLKNERPVWVQDFIFINPQKTLIATSKGLLLFDGSNYKDLLKEKGLKQMVINTVCAFDSAYYFGTQLGLYCLKFDKSDFSIEKIVQNGFVNFPITTLNVIESKLWIGTYEQGLYTFSNRKIATRSDIQGVGNQIILSMSLDDKKNIWFSTMNSGVCIYNLSSKNTIWLNDQSGLPNNHIKSVCQDNTGNYWLATSGAGLCYYLGKEFVHYDKNSGLNGNYIYSIYRDSKERLWIGNSDKGVSVIMGNKIFNPFISKAISGQKVRAIIEDNDGNLWFGTDGNGISFLPNKDSIIQSNFLSSSLYVRGFSKGIDGSIWIATAGNGIINIVKSGKKGNLISTQFTTKNGLIQDRVSAIATDNIGNIWYGTESNGVGVLDKNGNQIRKIQTANGIYSDNIKSIFYDGNLFIWVGTADNGIARINIKTNEITNYIQQLSSKNCYQIIGDNLGNIFVGSEKGLDFLTFNQKGGYLKTKHYGKGEGFLGIETVQNAVFKDKNGILWFGTINGLEKFNPNDEVKNMVSPIAHIADIKLFYNSISTGKYANFINNKTKDKHNFSYNDNHLTFDFDAINFSNPEGIKYAWRLLGYEDKWSPPSENMSVTYAKIPSGDYTFELKTSNEDGVWNKNPVQFKFSILTPFWKTIWFISLSLLGFFGLLWLLFKRRLNNLKRALIEKEKQIALERSVADLEQKALRLQMNPHFIFNALNSIQSLIGTNNETEARFYLAKFSRLMRQILDNSRNSLISLEDEILLLENYLLLEYFCHNKIFDYTIEVNPNVERDFIQIPPMLLQPFVENSIKHGILHLKERRGFIKLSFDELDDMLICVVEDNGIGRVTSAEINAKSYGINHESSALKITSERLILLNKNKNSVNVLDVLDEIGIIQGTKVIIKIQLK